MSDIALRLQRSGVFVPRVSAADPENNLIAFRQGGISLKQWVRNLVSKADLAPDQAPRKKFRYILNPQLRKQLVLLLRRVAITAARIHSNNVSHNHFHWGNVVVNGRKLGVIDLTKARVWEKLDWKKFEEVVDFFERDWDFVESLFSHLHALFPSSKPFLYAERKKFFERLARRYPTDRETRLQLKAYFERLYGNMPLEEK